MSGSRPYSLTLYSVNKPDDIDGIHASQHMIGYGLWSEFSILPHVNLRYCNTIAPYIDQTPVDFTLIHDCFDSPIYQRLPAVRQATRGKIMVIMEWPYQGPDTELVDLNFTFLPLFWARTEFVQFPCLRSVLTAETVAEKLSGSILLDHVWAPIEQTPQNWCPRLYEWLAPFAESRKIGQLTRNGHQQAEHFPPWVDRVSESFYREYLRRTATYETFILTHPGSFEHSIFDMVGRGIRVLVPVHEGVSFANPSIVAGLNLPTFSSQAELVALLTQPWSMETIRTDLMTDMSAIVGQINAYCQENLP
jgi:hypothetical protein